jgi:hypothetical protein
MLSMYLPRVNAKPNPGEESYIAYHFKRCGRLVNATDPHVGFARGTRELGQYTGYASVSTGVVRQVDGGAPTDWMTVCSTPGALSTISHRISASRAEHLARMDAQSSAMVSMSMSPINEAGNVGSNMRAMAEPRGCICKNFSHTVIIQAFRSVRCSCSNNAQIASGLA